MLGNCRKYRAVRKCCHCIVVYTSTFACFCFTDMCRYLTVLSMNSNNLSWASQILHGSETKISQRQYAKGIRDSWLKMWRRHTECYLSSKAYDLSSISDRPHLPENRSASLVFLSGVFHKLVKVWLQSQEKIFADVVPTIPNVSFCNYHRAYHSYAWLLVLTCGTLSNECSSFWLNGL